ncbi:MAG: EamA family transporter [Flavobacteriales bacterium]|nr:EamA family transporter [Flavobacteriales bacterium]
MDTHKPDRVAWALLFTLAAIWGSSFILIKRGLFDGDDPMLSPVQLASARLLIAWMALLPALFRYSTHLREHWKPLLFAALMGNGIPAFLFALAQSRISSALSGMLNGLTPFMTLIIGSLFFAKTIRWIHLAGITLGFAGAAALIAVRSEGTDPAWSGYALLVVLGTVCYGTSGNIVKHHLYMLPAPATASLALTFLGPLCLGIIWWSDLPGTLAADPRAWKALGYVAVLAVMSSAVAFILWNALLQRTSVVWASSVTYLMPVVAVGWGAMDGESIGAAELLLMTIILLAVYVVHVAEKR